MFNITRGVGTQELLAVFPNSFDDPDNPGFAVVVIITTTPQPATCDLAYRRADEGYATLHVVAMTFPITVANSLDLDILWEADFWLRERGTGILSHIPVHVAINTPST